MGFRRISVFFCVVLLASTAGSVHAANVLTNPNFDTDLTGWTPDFGASWDSTLDFGGNPPTNGSLLGTQAGNTLGSVARQCVSPVTPSVAYSLGAKVWVDTSQTQGWIEVTWYPSPGCTGVTITTSFGSVVTTTGAWNDSLPSGGNPVMSPGTAASAMVEIGMTNTIVDGARANFDNAFFGPGTFPVELQRFTAE
jgi:hypothetical protein